MASVREFWREADKIVKSTRPLQARINQLEDMLRDRDDPAAREEHRKLKEAVDTWAARS